MYKLFIVAILVVFAVVCADIGRKRQPQGDAHDGKIFCDLVKGTIGRRFRNPVLIRWNRETMKRIYYNENAKPQNLQSDVWLRAVCPGTEIQLTSLPHIKLAEQEQLLLRTSDNTFSFSKTGVSWSLDSLQCKECINYSFKKKSTTGLIVALGYDLTEFFYTIFNYEIDEKNLISRRVGHVIKGKELKTLDCRNDNSCFRGDHPAFKGKITKINDCYNIQNQQKALKKFTDLEIDIKKNYFAHGHLAANADFVASDERNASSNLINVAPQWQPINNGNWRKLESSIREMARKEEVDLHVVTGTSTPFLQLKLDEEYRNVCLCETGQLGQLCVPLFFWKVVPSKQKAFLMPNHPKAKIPEKIIKKSNCSGWPNISNSEDERRGRLYCFTPRQLCDLEPKACQYSEMLQF